MTSEELAAIEIQAQTEIDEQGHNASPFAVAVLHQRDAVSHLTTGIVFSPTCSGCTGLTQRAEQAERQLRNAESAVSSTVAEIQRMRDINISLDVQVTAHAQTIADQEAQIGSLQGENASHLDTIATLQAQIDALQGGG